MTDTIASLVDRIAQSFRLSTSSTSSSPTSGSPRSRSPSSSSSTHRDRGGHYASKSSKTSPRTGFPPRSASTSTSSSTAANGTGSGSGPRRPSSRLSTQNTTPGGSTTFSRASMAGKSRSSPRTLALAALTTPIAPGSDATGGPPHMPHRPPACAASPIRPRRSTAPATTASDRAASIGLASRPTAPLPADKRPDMHRIDSGMGSFLSTSTAASSLAHLPGIEDGPEDDASNGRQPRQPVYAKQQHLTPRPPMSTDSGDSGLASSSRRRAVSAAANVVGLRHPLSGELHVQPRPLHGTRHALGSGTTTSTTNTDDDYDDDDHSELDDRSTRTMSTTASVRNLRLLYNEAAAYVGENAPLSLISAYRVMQDDDDGEEEDDVEEDEGSDLELEDTHNRIHQHHIIPPHTSLTQWPSLPAVNSMEIVEMDDDDRESSLSSEDDATSTASFTSTHSSPDDNNDVGVDHFPLDMVMDLYTQQQQQQPDQHDFLDVDPTGTTHFRAETDEFDETGVMSSSSATGTLAAARAGSYAPLADTSSASSSNDNSTSLAAGADVHHHPAAASSSASTHGSSMAAPSSLRARLLSGYEDHEHAVGGMLSAAHSRATTSGTLSIGTEQFFASSSATATAKRTSRANSIFDDPRAASLADITAVADWDSHIGVYAPEIFAHLRALETRTRPKRHYMDTQQKSITREMRDNLVDYLVGVRADLNLARDTVFLAINYMDRYLSKRGVTATSLDVLTLSALLVASKYEEVAPPDVVDIARLLDHQFSVDDILDMEQDMLSVLGFRLNAAIPESFFYAVMHALGVNSLARGGPHRVAVVRAQHVLWMAVSDYDVAAMFLPSTIAGAAALVSIEVYGSGTNNKAADPPMFVSPRAARDAWTVVAQGCLGFTPGSDEERELSACVAATHRALAKPKINIQRCTDIALRAAARADEA